MTGATKRHRRGRPGLESHEPREDDDPQDDRAEHTHRAPQRRKVVDVEGDQEAEEDDIRPPEGPLGEQRF